MRPIPFSTIDDPAELFGAFRSGNVWALDYVYQLYRDALSAFAQRLLKDEVLRDDVISESFVKCWERRASFDSFEGIRYFLFSIVRNSCVNHLNRQRRLASKQEEILHFNTLLERDVETEQIRAELLQEVLLEAAKLPPKMKAVFQLVYVEQKSYEQVAKELGISVHTAKGQRFSAVAKVRRALAARGIVGSLFL